MEKLNDEAIFKPEGETLDEVLDGLKIAKEQAIQPEPEKEEKDNSSDSPAEENQKEDTQSSEGDKKEDKTSEDTQDAKDEPFHKRWEQQRNKLKREFDDELNSKLSEQAQQFEEKLQAFGKRDQTAQVPGWVKKIYGDSPEGVDFYREWRQEQEQEMQQLKKQIYDESLQKATNEKKEQERWQGWVKSELDDLEGEGKAFDRNKLMKVATDYMPTDEEGNISFSKAYAIYEKLEALEAKPEKLDARKKLADSTIGSSPNTGETKQKVYETSASLRNKSWFSLTN